MDKIKISKLNEVIYHEKLDNGLNIYIYKKKGFKKKTANLTSKYGSYHNEFKTSGEKDFRTYPKGIAHFLEHKLFESDDNEHVFSKFQKYGADVNAYTSHNETSYYFVTSNNFFKCLNLLLDFVWSPYFTDENVEKEKGIIKQEINMTNDNLSRFIYEKNFENSLMVNPNRYVTIGDKKNVEAITKNDLYECYNTFYNPSNMILTISGDVDIKKTIQEVKKNLSLKNFSPYKDIIIPEYKEKLNVYKEYEEVKRNVVTPRVSVTYKFIFPKLDSNNLVERTNLFSFLLDTKFGATTNFKQDLIDNKIIKSSFVFDYSIFDDVVLLSFCADVIDKEKFIELLDNKLKNNDYDEYVFNLNKKAYLASIVRSFDNPKAVINRVQRDLIRCNKVITDAYSSIEAYGFKDFVQSINKLDFSNKTILYITNMEGNNA